MTIFLDMDGVMVDFVSGAIEAADLPLTHDDVTEWDFFKPYMTSEEFWERIHDTYEFWEGLQPYPWAQRLYDVCRGFDEVVFLSDSSHDVEAPSGKVKWLRRHGFLNDDASNYMLGRRKDLVRSYDDVLIDDNGPNCLKWNKFICFPRPWNGGGELDPVRHVEELLEIYYDRVDRRSVCS